MFTCTGSEANDLALRIARFHTGGDGVVVTGFAYHGGTTARPRSRPTWDRLSRRGRSGRSRHRYRGTTGEALAARVRAAIADLSRHGIRLAAFIADTMFSSDGIFPGPAGFLRPVAAGCTRPAACSSPTRCSPASAAPARRCGASSGTASPPTWSSWASRWATACRSPRSRPARSCSTSSARSPLLQHLRRQPGRIAAAAAVLDVIEDEGLQPSAKTTGEYLRDKLDLAPAAPRS